ncbi:Exodeoxyribonuclease 7 large subunit [subsurface metagenome]
MQEVLGRLAYFEKSLASKARAKLELCGENLQTILANAVFRNPFLLVQNAEQQLDELAIELAEAIRELLVAAQYKLSASYEQIVRIEPHRLLGNKRDELNNWRHRIDKGVSAIVSGCRMQLTAQANRLVGLNPKSVLQRGYSITTNKKTGLLVKTLEDVRIGDRLLTELTDENLIESKVTKK